MTNASPHLAATSVEPAVEAARYALLRRLAFAIRHDMMADLQPIAMTGEVLERRLRAPAPDLEQVREAAARITRFARTAVQSCVDVITWMAPEPGRVMALQAVVAETTALLASSFGFRGFVVRDAVGEAPWPVLRAGLRLLLPACLFLLADEAGPPAEITLTAEDGGDLLRVLLTLEPSDGPEPGMVEPTYRVLAAAEVEALARSEGIGFARNGDTIVLTLPRASEPEQA